jgi:hypothetical protein
MATASSSSGRGAQNAYDSIAASATDSVLVAAIPGKRIRVLSAVINQGDTTPSTVTFNSKGSGAGTAVFPALKASANGGFVLPENSDGWFTTNAGEALTVTTGAGSTTAVIVTYELVHIT